MKKIRSGFLILVALAVLIAGQSAAMAKQDTGFITGPDRRGVEEIVAPFATLNLPNGDVLDFVEVRGERQAIIGFLVFAMVHRDSDGYQAVERLQDANALEIFNALSERGTDIPREMAAVHGRAVLGPQGWALPLLLEAGNDGTASGYCHPDAASAYNTAMNFGLNNYNNSFQSLNDGPMKKPQHWHKGQNHGHPIGLTYNLYGSASRVTSFSTAVAMCQVDSWYSSAQGIPYLNYVHVKYRQSGGPVWATYKQGQLTEDHRDFSVELKLANYYMPSATEFDFRLEIISGQADGVFRIGATWHTKINDIVLKK